MQSINLFIYDTIKLQRGEAVRKFYWEAALEEADKDWTDSEAQAWA